MSAPIVLDGNSLIRDHVVAIARGTRVTLDGTQLEKVQRTADFLAAQVKRGEPIYGVTTGFGSNADKLLGAHRARDELPGGNPEAHELTLMEELQYNLVVTHAVCVGKPLAPDVVRAMLAIRVNTLLRGHSGIRASTLQALARREIGGTPASDPRGYALRSPLDWARKLAFSGVPLQIWWSTRDRVVTDQRNESGRLYRMIKRVNPAAPVTEFVGKWAHTTEMKSHAYLPYALSRFDLLPPRAGPPGRFV